MNDSPQGIKLDIHFLDGSPTGMLTAEVPHWIGHVLFAPSLKIDKALERGEAEYAGIYILLGSQPKEDRRVAYIGLAENLSDRIHTSAKEQEKKEFEWESVVFVTAIGNRLNTAHIKYLEARLIERAKRINSVYLTNVKDESVPELSEGDQCSMDWFLHYLFLVLPAIRVDMFNDDTRKTIRKPDSVAEADEHAFEIKDRGSGIAAMLDTSGGEIVVLSGSLAKRWNEEKFPIHSYRTLQTCLVDQSVLAPDDEGDWYKFKENYAFNSISAAASVVLGRPASGPQEWKHKATKKRYRDWKNDRDKQQPSES
ncbi:MAG: GIY-YIG nuclease family protein [Gammaproteobacteria bacterium]|nr:GIY-YIG nuclease family protein [Gammaproteobacteria bacterium]MDE0413212.1 GIY-YIG nuclease family protein [Gammaproteobacteria bacterium]